MTYQQITGKFLEFERKHNLLYLEVCGVFPWQICRVILFLQIVDHYIPGNTGVQRKSKFTLLKNLSHRIFINCIFFNPFLDFKKKNVLIFESGRKYFDENSYMDIYTEYLCRDLKADSVSFTRYETNYNLDELFFRRDFKVKHVDFILLTAKFKKSFVETIFLGDELMKIKHISKSLKETFNVTLDLSTIFSQEINKFKAEKKLYGKLLKVKNPEEIFIINSSEHSALIDAAKKSGILVNELQHGLISEKSVVSNFPNIKEGSLQYSPDRFYAWSNTPMCFGKLPIKEEFIIPFQNQHIAKWVERTKDHLKDEKTILIISQPYSSKEIQEFVEANMDILQNYSIIYKIHPAENVQNFSDFKSRLSERKNIKFLNNEESIYVLLKKATYAVGIYSSSLFEAVAFDCKVILLNLPGVEMSFPLLKNRDNILIEPTEKLSDFL